VRPGKEEEAEVLGPPRPLPAQRLHAIAHPRSEKKFSRTSCLGSPHSNQEGALGITHG